MTKRKLQRGFTIVELMIASLVFSILLLLLTTMIIRISHTYYKGIIASKTQETARSISSSISQAIQFGGGVGVSTDNATFLCVGSVRYRYSLGFQVADSGPLTPPDKAYHALIEEQTPCLPAGVAVSGMPQNISTPNTSELIPTSMRLSKLTVTPVPATTNLYTITVRVVYGDIDLICSPSVGGDCAATGPSTGWANNDLVCRPLAAGSQFCAVSELTTTVEKRI